LPGVLMALVVRFSLTEPPRGMAENRTAADAAPFGSVLKLLWSRRSFRHIALGAALNAFAGYSTSSWTASFFIRSHNMETGELGTWLAMILGFGGAVGVFFGGLIAERLARNDVRWYMWLPCATGVICLPFMVGIYVVDGAYVALSLSIVPGLLFNVYLGNALAMTHGLVGLRMRALASALLFFVINIIGLGIGPWFVGFLSDQLEPTMGIDSLRYAMLYTIPAAMLWSVGHFFLSASSLREELADAPD